MSQRTHSQTQPASSSASPPASNPESHRRPGKEKAIELTELDSVQRNACQVQLEEAVGVMNQEMSTIKEFLERLFVPKAPVTTRGDDVVEERCAEQQAAKTTMRGQAASGHPTNLQLVP